MQNWRTIGYVNWQSKFAPSPATPALGEIAFGHLDPIQAVNAIVLTEKGTVPLEPEKCVRLMPWIDKPEPIAIPNLTRQLWDAIALYEPRVVLEKISPKWLADSHWLFLIAMHFAGDVDKRSFTVEVPYGA